jgi:RND family efflux transporter MFP subunit
MKPYFYFIAIITLSISACGKKAETDKQATLDSYKKDQIELTKKIKDLEAQLGVKKETNNTKVVGTMLTQIDTFVHYIEVQGKVEGDNNVNVSAKLPGTITRINVSKGQRVGVGQVLAELDASVVRQSIEQVRTQLQFAKDIYQKQNNLWTQGIGTEVQYLGAKNNVTSLEQQISTMQKQYDMYKITSPISGTVDEVVSKDGEACAPGFPSFRVVNLSSLKVTGNIADTYMGRVKAGNDVIVTYPDINKTSNARIRATSNVIDPINRGFSIEIRPGDTRELKPNMIAQIKVKDYENAAAIVVPSNCIQNSDEGTYVYVVVDNNGIKKVEKRIITTGQHTGSNTEVTSGLQANESIVTTGGEELVNGDVVVE